MSSSWKISNLTSLAKTQVAHFFDRNQHKSANGLFWQFYFEYRHDAATPIHDYQQGQYHPKPMKKYHFPDETLIVWEFGDRLIHYLILKQIQPTFKHVFSDCCHHLNGYSGVREALSPIQDAVNSHQYKYVIRFDIKGYYASIAHDILIKQLLNNYDDPRLRTYFPLIISPLVDDDGWLYPLEKGLPRRSTLSPFFGAMYLTPLDRALEKRNGVVYSRFMDDGVVLIKTLRQYKKIKTEIKTILIELKLKLSHRKTKMGLTKHGFHFLGVKFPATRIAGNKIQKMTARPHERTCRRALTKITAMTNNAVNYPAPVLRYLIKWARWWSRTSNNAISAIQMIIEWVRYVKKHTPWLVKYGLATLIAYYPDGARMANIVIGSL